MTIHGFKGDFKEEEPEKEKEKEREKEKEKEKEDEDFSDRETKEKEKEREKEKVILLKMKAIGRMKNGKDMKMRIGMKAIGPMLRKSWDGVGMLTFFELAHILDAMELRLFCPHKHASCYASCDNERRDLLTTP